MKDASEHFDEQPNPKPNDAAQLSRHPFRGIETGETFLSRWRPPDYLVDGVLQGGMLYSLTGFTGHAKTSLMLHLAICIAEGQFFGTAECEKGSVLILAGENPENVMSQWMAACAQLKFDPLSPKIHWHYDRFAVYPAMPELKRQCEAIPDLRLIVADTLQAFFPGDNDNDNMQMLQAAIQFRPLLELSSRPAVIVPCHPSGKTADRRNLIPRGGSAFLNEVDGNLTVWKDGTGKVTFHTQGKHRGPHFDPLHFIAEEKEFGAIADSKGRKIPMTVVRPLLEMEKRQLAEEASDLDLRLMRLIAKRDGRISQREAAEALEVSQSKSQRAFEKLQNDKLLKRQSRKWKITSEGTEWMNDASEDH